MRELCYKARELLIEEGNVVSVDAPVTVGLCLDGREGGVLVLEGEWEMGDERVRE